MRKLLAAAAVATALAGAAGFADPGPNGNNNFGLCKAYFAGSDTGRAHKRNAPPFRALEDAAGVDEDDTAAERDEKVREFCRNVQPGGGDNGGGAENARGPRK